MHTGDQQRGWSQEARAIVRLAAPVAVAQLGMMALGVVDVAMVGHLSREALAAVSLGHAYAFGLMILGMGMLFVMDPLVSQAFGARDTKGVAGAFHQGIVLALIISLILAGLFHITRPLLMLLADQPETVPVAHDYVKVIAYGLPAFFLFIVFKQTLQAMSIVRPVMIAVVIGNGANVFLNLGFVYGRFGFPEMGAVGSAWASTCCRYLMAAIIIAAAAGALRRIWHPPTRALLDWRGYLPVVLKGSQIGVIMAFEVWVFTAASFTMMRIGLVEMGGHTVALNLASISFMLPLGVGAAASTRVGNAIGAGDFVAARHSAKISIAIGAGVMLVSAVLFIVVPELLASLYTSDPDVIAMAALLLPVAGLFQVFDGTQAVACGVLRGAGETRVPMVINILGYWVIGYPLGLLLAFQFGFGPAGLWWGLTAGLATCALALVYVVGLKIRDH